MNIFSSAFKNNELIPAVYTCDDRNISPPLEWQGVHANAKSLVLIVDDPDAPVGTWVHWVLFNLPADLTSLPADAQKLPQGAVTGTNSWSRQKYGGPCPPSGRHHYYFKLFALDDRLELTGKATSADLEIAMRGHILDKAELIGVYR